MITVQVCKKSALPCVGSTSYLVRGIGKRAIVVTDAVRHYPGDVYSSVWGDTSSLIIAVAKLANSRKSKRVVIRGILAILPGQRVLNYWHQHILGEFPPANMGEQP